MLCSVHIRGFDFLPFTKKTYSCCFTMHACMYYAHTYDVYACTYARIHAKQRPALKPETGAFSSSLSQGPGASRRFLGREAGEKKGEEWHI